MHPLYLPLDQEPITVSWRRPDIGGLCVGAYTGQKGEPNITVMRLDKNGDVVGGMGSPTWFESYQLQSKVIIGFDKTEPVKVEADISLSYRGLQMKLIFPWEEAPVYGYHRCFFQLWNNYSLFKGMFEDTETANYVLTKTA